MSYYSITINGEIYSQNLGYFTIINVYSKNVSCAIDKAVRKIKKNVMNNYNYYTDNFTITDVEEKNFKNKNINYCFYNL